MVIVFVSGTYREKGLFRAQVTPERRKLFFCHSPRQLGSFKRRPRTWVRKDSKCRSEREYKIIERRYDSKLDNLGFVLLNGIADGSSTEVKHE
jgi:hypothetical protein